MLEMLHELVSLENIEQADIPVGNDAHNILLLPQVL
jgi:hypothetical protein